jgi:hypothetical protein
MCSFPQQSHSTSTFNSPILFYETLEHLSIDQMILLYSYGYSMRSNSKKLTTIPYFWETAKRDLSRWLKTLRSFRSKQYNKQSVCFNLLTRIVPPFRAEKCTHKETSFAVRDKTERRTENQHWIETQTRPPFSQLETAIKERCGANWATIQRAGAHCLGEPEWESATVRAK